RSAATSTPISARPPWRRWRRTPSPWRRRDERLAARPAALGEPLVAPPLSRPAAPRPLAPRAGGAGEPGGARLQPAAGGGGAGREGGGGAGGALRPPLPFYARLLALGCLIVALARPQMGYAWEESLTEGIDIMIVLDISGSMGAEDFQPKDRLTVAKQVVKELIAGRTGDRIGVTIFSGGAMTRAPLTTDREMLGTIVDAVELNSLPDGTAIGVALASAAARLKDSQAKTKVVVLVTDGANNAGAIDPVSAAALCKGLGLKVYTIGVG